MLVTARSLSQSAANPSSHDFRTMASLPSLEVYRAIEKTHAEQVDVLKDVEGLTLTTVIQPMSSSAMKATLKSPLGLSSVGQQCTSPLPLSGTILEPN